MNTLITNDDGVYAPGMWALARELKSLGPVTIVAPDREQSGMGTAVSLYHPVRVNRARSLAEGIDAWAVEGTPADGAIMGLRHVIKDPVDLIVSGINEGRNLGDDVFISGTVGAAMQGHFHGIPTIAISVASVQNIMFGPAARLVGIIARRVQAGALPHDVLLNINFPNVPVSEMKGIAITRLGEQVFNFNIQPGTDGRREYYWIQRGKPRWSLAPGSDRWAIQNKYISITALLEHSSSPLLPILRNLAPGLFEELKAGAREGI